MKNLIFFFLLGALLLQPLLAQTSSESDQFGGPSGLDEISHLHEQHENFEELPIAVREGVIGFFQKWGLKFDPRLYVSNIYRNYYMEENDHFREGLKDIIFLFSISHPIEMSTGFIFGFFGVTQGFDLQLASLTVIGFIISIPGLDPLCLLLSGTYLTPERVNLVKLLTLGLPIPKVKDMKYYVNLSQVHRYTIKPFRRAVRGARHLTWGAATWTADKFNLPEGFNKLFPPRDRLEFADEALIDALGSDWAQILPREDGSVEYVFRPRTDWKATGDPELRLIFSKNSLGYYLSDLEFNDLVFGDKAKRKEVIKWLRQFRGIFGRNVSSAIVSAFKSNHLDELPIQRFFVEKVLRSGQNRRWQFKAGAIHSAHPRRLKVTEPLYQLQDMCRLQSQEL